MGGPRLLGDAVAWIDTRADLVLGGVTWPRPQVAQSLPDDRRGGSGRRQRQLVHAVDAVHRDQSFSAATLTPMTVSSSRFLGKLSSDVRGCRRTAAAISCIRPSCAPCAGGNIGWPTMPRATTTGVAAAVRGRPARDAGGPLHPGHGAHVSMSAADAPLRPPWRPAFSAFEVSNGNPIPTNTSKDGVQPGALGTTSRCSSAGLATNRAARAMTPSPGSRGHGRHPRPEERAVVDMRGPAAARTPGTRPPCRYRCGRPTCAWMSPRCTTMRATCR